jgi:citrate synthase
MLALKEKLAQQIPGLREEVRQLTKNHGDAVISEATVAQVFGGMRGIKGLVCDTSVVDPDKGLYVRGMPIADLANCLPEAIFYLLCAGELPDREALASLQQDLRKRA